MARIAMVVPVWIGHLNPMTTLGRELQRRGHDVTVLSFPDAAAGIARADLRHHVIGNSVFPVGEWERRTRELSVLQGYAAARYTVEWLAPIADVMLDELPGALTGGRFDGLVMDQVCYGAECAAETARVPLTMACNALPVHLQPDVPIHSKTWSPSPDGLSRTRNRLAQHLIVELAKPVVSKIKNARLALGHRWDVWHHLNEVPPSLAQVAQLPACLDFPRSHAPDHFHHTGPWHEPGTTQTADFDWSWLDGRPLIYASLGTLQNGLDQLYQIILDACADLPMQIVLTLGRADGNRPQQIPANACVLGYGPQLALLQRASLVVTHAGMNTTLESLAQGLPMVALPIANEQPGIASRIRHAGVGEWLSIRALKPARIRAVIEKVYNEPSYRQRARECARQLAGNGGLRRAADIIEQAVTERRRVLRT